MQLKLNVSWAFALACTIILGVAACGGGGSDGDTTDGGGGTVSDTGSPVEDAGGMADAGEKDAGEKDTGGVDTGETDAGIDAGIDAGTDAGEPDGGQVTNVTEQEPNGMDPATGEITTQDVTIPVAVEGGVADPVDCVTDELGVTTCTTDIDAYGFTAKAGDVVRIACVAADLMNPLINLIDMETQGGRLFRAANLTAEKTSALTAFIPYDGTYAVLLGERSNLGQTPANVGGAGYEYTLTITGAALATQAIAALPLDKAYTMAKDAPDAFTYAATKKELLQIETIANRLATPSEVDTFITLFDVGTKTVLGTHDNIDANNSILDASLRAFTPGAGEQLIIVEATFYTAAQKTDYELLVASLPPDKEAEPNGGFDTAFPFPFPGTIDGTIGTPVDGFDADGNPIKVGDVDLFWFDAKAGDFVTFSIQAAQKNPASQADTYIGVYQVVDTIFGPQPVPVGMNNNSVGLDSRADALIPADGRYYAAVMDARNTSDNADPVGGDDYFYTLKGEMGTMTTATVPALPYAQTTAVDPGGTFKFYKLPVKKAQKVTVEVTTHAGASAAFFPYVMLYDTDLHTPIAGAGDGTATTAALERLYSADGTYLLAVSDYMGEGGADFLFDLSIAAVDVPFINEQEQNDDYTTANVLDKNPQLAFGTLDGDAQTDMADVYKFTATVGQVLNAQLWGGAQPEILDTVLRVLDDKGQALAVNEDFGSSYYSGFADWPIQYDGTFYLSVEPQIDYGPVKGSYVLEFSLSSCAAGVDAPAAGDLVINEFLVSLPAGTAGDANGDGVTDPGDQFVELFNKSGKDLNLATLTVNNATKAVYTFPCGTIVPKDASLVVFGGGAPAGSFGGAVVAVSRGLELAETGDTISVKNGATTVVTQPFGSVAADKQSSVRDPDITGGFVKHGAATGANGALFSPGTRINGLPFSVTGALFAETEGNNAKANANALPALPVAITGTLKFWETAGDDLEDWFSFNATAGQKLTARTMAGKAPDITDTTLELYDANGTILADGADISFDNWYSEIVDFELAAGGTYYLVVKAEVGYGHVPASADEPGSYLCDVSVK